MTLQSSQNHSIVSLPESTQRTRLHGERDKEDWKERMTGERRNVGENRLLFRSTVSFALAALNGNVMIERRAHRLKNKQTVLHELIWREWASMSILGRYFSEWMPHFSSYTENIQLSASCWTEIIIKANIIIVSLIIRCAYGFSMRVVCLLCEFQRIQMYSQHTIDGHSSL